jgi:hypothetical protein
VRFRALKPHAYLGHIAAQCWRSYDRGGLGFFLLGEMLNFLQGIPGRMGHWVASVPPDHLV